MTVRTLILTRKSHGQTYPVTAVFTNPDRARDAVDDLLADPHGLAWFRLVELVDGERHELIDWQP